MSSDLSQNGGEGVSPYIPNITHLAGNIVNIRLPREQLIKADTRWADMQKYLAAIT